MKTVPSSSEKFRRKVKNNNTYPSLSPDRFFEQVYCLANNTRQSEKRMMLLLHNRAYRTTCGAQQALQRFSDARGFSIARLLKLKLELSTPSIKR
jgi:hypothetical protein